jgi:hypothetical protein
LDLGTVPTICFLLFFTSLFVFPDTSTAVFYVSMHINYHVSFPLDNQNTPEYKWLWNETLLCVSISEIFKEAANRDHFGDILSRC